MHMDISREPPSVDIAHKHRNDCSYVSDLSNFLFLLTLETLYEPTRPRLRAGESRQRGDDVIGKGVGPLGMLREPYLDR